MCVLGSIHVMATWRIYCCIQHFVGLPSWVTKPGSSGTNLHANVEKMIADCSSRQVLAGRLLGIGDGYESLISWTIHGTQRGNSIQLKPIDYNLQSYPIQRVIFCRQFWRIGIISKRGTYNPFVRGSSPCGPPIKSIS